MRMRRNENQRIQGELEDLLGSKEFRDLRMQSRYKDFNEQRNQFLGRHRISNVDFP